MKKEKLNTKERMNTETVSFRTSKGKRVNFMAKKHNFRPKYNFPKNPSKGERKTIVNSKHRKITFEATGYSGKKFGKPKWRIISNVKA